jgi:hypothetical protein
MPARNSRRSVTIRRVQPVLWSEWVRKYVVTSCNNRRGVESGVLCGSDLKLYDSTEFGSASECSAVKGLVVEC